jgi:hypothetical protein
MSSVQDKNILWYLPRPKPDHYKGGMPLYAEEWLIKLAKEILNPYGIFDFPEPNLLNVFCGMNKYGTRVDLNPEVKPDYLGDIHKLSKFLPPKIYDIILADPPYSTEESKELYGTGKLSYKTWTNECDKFLKPGGLLIVYHKLVPANPNPEKYSVVKRVCIMNRIWHLPRVAIYFQKRIDVE